MLAVSLCKPDGKSPSRFNSPRCDAICILLVSLLCVAVCLPLLTQFPAPGGDEPGFVDAAVTLAKHGYLGTQLFTGLLPTMEHHIYWMPPLYFVALAGWFKIFGIGLVQARAFSVLCAVVIVSCVYLLSRRWVSAPHAFMGATLCAVSFWLVDHACFARMDNLCVAFILASILLYQDARDRAKLSLYGLSGLLAGLAFLTHPLGLIAITTLVLHFALAHQKTILRTREFYILLGCFALCTLVWLIYIEQDITAFRIQMHAQITHKMATWSYWQQFLIAKTHSVTLIVVLYACVWLISGGWRQTQSGILAIAFVTAFAAATYGHELGYFIFFIPLACVVLSVASGQTHKWQFLVYFAFAAAFTNESVLLINDMGRYHYRDYAALTRAIRAVIPPGKSVFIGNADVTPYFALLGRNPMRVAIPVPLPDPQAHIKVAHQCDFVVDSIPEHFLPDIAAFVSSNKPIAVINQGKDYRIAIFSGRTQSVEVIEPAKPHGSH